MQIRSICAISIEADEPVASIRQFVRVLRAHVIPTERTKVAVKMLGTSTRAAGAIKEFSPNRTDGASFDRSLAVIEELTNLGPSKLKSLVFNLSAEGFLWKGAPTDTSGKLHLGDLKVFRKKQRFGLSAILDFQSSDAQSSDTSAILTSVNQQTGLNFSIKGSSVLFDPNDAQASAAQLLVTQLAWNVLTQAVGKKIRGPFNALALPQVMSSDASIDYRFDPVKLGKSVRVDFRKTVRRWFKEAFPDYKRRRVDIDDHGIRKTISEHLHLFFYFDKRPGAFSKAFTARIGIEFTAPPFAPLPDRPHRVEIDFFELFGLFMYGWSYFTQKDLDTALNGARHVIRAALDFIEEEGPVHLDNTLERELKEFEGPRDLTARQAYDLVYPSVQEWASDAALNSIQLFPVCTSPTTLAVGLPLHAGEGRLGKGGQWRLMFLSPAKREHLQFCIPWRGPITRSGYSFSRGENMVSSPEMAKLQGINPFSDRWIDSDRALELALDKLVLEGATPAEVVFEMRQDWRNGATWRLLCQWKKDGRLNLIHVEVPADGQGSVGHTVSRFNRDGTPTDEI